MKPNLEEVPQPKILTEAEAFNCRFTSAGQLVLDSTHPLQQQPTLFQKAHLRAAIYWLEHYQGDQYTTPAEQVRGYLEAAHHLEQLQAWDLIRQILFVPIHVEGKAQAQVLHKQLGDWGFYREQIALCQSLLQRINTKLDCFCLNTLGYAHTHLCQFSTAASYFERLLQLAQQIQNKKAQAEALGGLGLCYSSWGQYQRAWSYCQQQLRVLAQIEKYGSTLAASEEPLSTFQSKLDQEIDCTWSVQVQRGQALAILGYLEIYHLRRFRKAVHYCQEALVIASSLGDQQTQWYALGRLAVANALLGKQQKALEALQQQYQQRHHNQNCRQVSTMLINLGMVYCYQRNFQAAITCAKELLEITQQSGDVSFQSYALLSLSFIQIWQDEVQLAMETTQQCLRISRQCDYSHHESQSLSHLSYLYSALGETVRAINYGEQALVIAQDLSNSFRGIALAVLGLAYLEAGKYGRCLHYIFASFRVVPPWQGGDSKLLLALIYKRVLRYLAKLCCMKS